MASGDMMKVVGIRGGKGPASALVIEDRPIPDASDGELLIKVHASGVNRPDLMQRQGLYPPPSGASDILGLEVAGEVVRAAGRWQVGDRVCALLAGGGYAEYAVCDPRHALPIPANTSSAEAAGLPETVFTVFANVFEQGRLQAGETFMVHGATSGIGVTAIQMAKAAGAKVIATARGAGKAEAALTFGADVAVDTSRQDFAAIAKQEGGVDLVLEMVGGDYLAKDLDALRMDGRIVFIASQAGWEPSLPVMSLMQKRAVVTGSTLRARDADEKARLAEVIERVVWPWLEAGQLRPAVDKVFPLSDAAAAHAYLEAGSHVGKVVLSVAG